MSSKSIIGLNKFNNKEIRVKLCGGREIVGILRGFDGVTNLVMDDTVEYIFDYNLHFNLDSENSSFISSQKRHLGLLVVRGATVLMICPKDGSEIIENPFYDFSNSS